MKKILTVLTNEIITVISRPSFWLAMIGLPLIGAGVFAFFGWLGKDSATAQAVTQAFTTPHGLQAEGFVDLSGIIQQVEPYVPPDTFIPYPDEEAARAALAAGEIIAFYLIPVDYLKTGQITYIRPDFNPLAAGSAQSFLFEWLLRVNLVSGDTMKATLLNGPIDLEDVALASTPLSYEKGSELNMWVPYAITLVFYILIISSASLLLSNISKEKENRIIEVLLTSVTPNQLLTGKIVALGIVGLLQTIIWVGVTVALLNLSGKTFQLVTTLQIPTSFLAWGLAFFLFGYAVYASLMAGLGALAPNLREASQATFVIMLPLMIPLFLGNNLFAQAPHGSIATALSIFPLTAPVAMMARLSLGGVAWWQPWLALILLALTAVLIVRAVAGMFRAQTLLSGQEFNVKKYFRALAGKV